MGKTKGNVCRAVKPGKIKRICSQYGYNSKKCKQVRKC